MFLKDIENWKERFRQFLDLLWLFCKIRNVVKLKYRINFQLSFQRFGQLVDLPPVAPRANLGELRSPQFSVFLCTVLYFLLHTSLFLLHSSVFSSAQFSVFLCTEFCLFFSTVLRSLLHSSFPSAPFSTQTVYCTVLLSSNHHTSESIWDWVKVLVGIICQRSVEVFERLSLKPGALVLDATMGQSSPRNYPRDSSQSKPWQRIFGKKMNWLEHLVNPSRYFDLVDIWREESIFL